MKQVLLHIAFAFAVMFSFAMLFDRHAEADYLFKSALVASILYAGTRETKE